MNGFYFNGNPYQIQGIELHMRSMVTGLDELIFFKDPHNVQCTTEIDTIEANGKPLTTATNHHISFDCGGVSFANVHSISPIEDPDKAMAIPESEDNSDDSLIRW